MNNDSTIHIAGIDIPLKLVDAANKNELVIFAGAGVSSPGIPVFDELVKEALEKVKNKHDGTVAKDAFANQAGIDNAKSKVIWDILQEKDVFDERGNIHAQSTINRENINTWLGGESEAVKDHVLVILQQAHDKIASLPERLDRLQHDGIKVKELVANVISKYQKEPENCSQNHQTLLKFFKPNQKNNHIRIVTTNYDSNFYKAAEKLGLKSLQHYCQPILPFGDEFKGIVYLHGRINDIDSMIMTQTDFSEAYLNRQRTRLFLQELFNQYTVLFVGYSFKDELIKYIFKSFNNNDFKDKAFALIPKQESENAEYLGITPLMPSTNGSDNQECYEKIWDCLKRWGERNNESKQQSAERLETIITNGPGSIEGNQEHNTWLAWVLKTRESHVESFCNEADHSWVKWCKDAGLLVKAFQNNSETMGGIDWIFINWFAGVAVSDQSDNPYSLSIIEKAKILSQYFVNKLVRVMVKKEFPQNFPEKHVKRWVNIIAYQPFELDRDFLFRLLKNSGWQSHSDEFLIVLDQFLRPYAFDRYNQSENYDDLLYGMFNSIDNTFKDELNRNEGFTLNSILSHNLEKWKRFDSDCMTPYEVKNTLKKHLGLDYQEPPVAKFSPSKKDLEIDEIVDSIKENSFEWGYSWAQETITQGPVDPSIWDRVIQAWREQSLAQDDVKQVVQFLLNNHQSLQACHAKICQFLSENAEVLKAHTESQTLANTIRDAIFNDQTIGPLARYEAGEESEEAINSSGFYLCKFYIRSIQYDDNQPISDDTLNRAVGSFFENQSYSAKMGRSALAYHLAFLYQKNKSWTIQKVLPLFNWDPNYTEATRSWGLSILSNRWNEALLEQLLKQKEGSFINFKGLGESRKIFCQQMAALALSVAVFRGETVLEKAWFQSFLKHCESKDFKFFAQGLSSVFHDLVKDETRDQSKKIEYLNKSWAVFLKEYVNSRHLGVPIKIEPSEYLALLDSGLYLMDASFSEFVETLNPPLIKNLNPGHHNFVLRLENQKEGKNKSAIAKLLIFLLDHGLVSSVEKQLFLDKLVQSIQDDISDDLKAELDARM